VGDDLTTKAETPYREPLGDKLRCKVATRKKSAYAKFLLGKTASGAFNRSASDPDGGNRSQSSTPHVGASVSNNRPDFVAFEPISAIEKLQFDQKRNFQNLRTELLHERRCSRGSAASGEKIVN
jgi:hypothetical protein